MKKIIGTIRPRPSSMRLLRARGFIRARDSVEDLADLLRAAERAVRRHARS
jgi:hypothetical protein